MKLNTPFRRLLSSLIIALVGITMLFFTFFSDLNNNSIISKWSTTEARILRAFIYEKGSGKSYCASPDVLYEYKVANNTYRSNLLWLEGSCFRGNERLNFENKYKINQYAYIYYDPLNNSIAVLEPRLLGRRHWINAAIAFSFLIFPLLILFLELTWRSRP